MHKYWELDQKDMVRYMLKAGKHKAHKDIHTLQKIVTNIKSKYKSLHQASSHTPYSWTQFRRFFSIKSVARRKLEFSRKLSPEAVSAIQEHMCLEEISFPVPDWKYAGKRFMHTSMKKTLDMYNLSEKMNRRISLATLYRHRPKHVKLQGKIPLHQACCEKCLNFDNVSKIISQYLEGTHKDLNLAVDSTLCPYLGIFPRINCVLCTCKDCGTDKLKTQLVNSNGTKLQDNRTVLSCQAVGNQNQRI